MKQKTSQKGFTLIEMVVAVGLFSVVMLVAVAAILSIIGNNKKAQAINNVVNNLNFAIESMVRDMKTGQYYQCPSSGWTSLSTDQGAIASTCVGAESAVAFYSTLSGTDVEVEYSFVQGGTVNGIETPGYIAKSTGDGNSPIELTSTTDVDIKSMKLYVNNPAPGTGQPSIFLIITGEAKILDNQVTQFGLQTLVSRRVLNLP